jgi:uncharacterized membrane protein YfcA
VGFGLGLISVPLLVLINPVYVPGPVLLAAFFLNLLIFLRERHAIHIKGLHWAVFGRIFGAVFGAMILVAIPQKSLSVMFGLMVLIAIGISLVGIHPKMTSKNIFGAGVASGIMGTTSSIGGPPMALIYQRHEGPTVRGTLSGIFIFGTIISLTALTVVGNFGLKEIKATGVLMPGVCLGFLLSNRSTKIFDRGLTRTAVLITSAISGIVVILRSLFMN